jgi:TonB-linked SusC/RagA family outer membrane protein
MNRTYVLIMLIFIIFSHLSKVNGKELRTRLEAKTEISNDNPKVTGKVVDSKTGEPIIGATIAIKGTVLGTVTDIDGSFSLIVQDTNAILVVSFVGYEKKELPVQFNTEIIINLETKSTELEQVVVIGYGVQKKADLIGAISTITSKDIISAPVSDVIQAIQGRAAGVEVIANSGAPGSETSIKIRGTGTVNNSDPLYIVDGFIVESISYLNSEDIKDFQVLKDASSAAIYGARAANGVVLITTKKGEKGIHVSFYSYWGSSQFWNKPSICDKEGFRDLYESIYNRPLVGSKSDSIIYHDYAVNNWLDYIIRDGFTQKYNLQITGGNEKSTYLVSGSWSNDQGIVKKTGYEKRSIRLSLENKLMKILTLRSNLQATGSDRTMAQEGEYNIFQYALNEPPCNPLYNITNLIVGGTEGDSIISFNKVLNTTPYSRLWGTDMSSNTSSYLGNFELLFQIANSITNSTRAGFNLEYFSESDFFGKNSDPYTYFTYGTLGINYGQNAVKQTDISNTKWQIEDILTFSKKLGKNAFTVIGGVSLEGYHEKQTSASRAMAPDIINSLKALDATYVNPEISGYGSEWKSIGVPFRIDYNFAEKYLFQFNFRADASSIFIADKRWGKFPSVSVGWKLNEEPLLKDIKWLTLLKVRANWGLSGNNRIYEYAANTMVHTNPSFYYVLGQQPFYKPGWTSDGIGNQDIVWEKTDSKNVGIDVSLFQGSISGTLEVFDKTTSDMLLQLPVVLSSGMTGAPWQNAGEVKNTGYEISASYRKGIHDLSFDVSVNFTRIYNRVENLGQYDEPIWGGHQDENAAALKSTYLTLTAVGHPIGSFYGWKIDRSINSNGIWQTKDMPTIAGRALPTAPDKVVAGDFIFKDLNGDGRIDENDKTFLGSPLPDFSYGLNIVLKYKAVDLSMFFQGVYGNEIFNVEKYWLYAFHFGSAYQDVNSVRYNLSDDNNVANDLYANSWSPANENAKYPVLKNQIDNNNNYRVSDFYIEDGSYLRLKNLQLGFTLPQKWGSHLKLKNLRVYLVAYNLLTITKYSGFDPEIGNQVNTSSVGTVNTAKSNTSMGIDIGSYPQARTYICGLNVDF